MARHKVIIECEARFIDHLTNESKVAADAIGDIGSAADKTQKEVDKLGKKKFKPIFDADNNKFLKKIREAESRAEKLGKTKTTIVLKALDKATNVIGKVLNKAQSFGGSVWNAVLRVKDSQAMQSLGKVISAGKNIAGKTWQAIVTVKDKASSTIKNITNKLFSLKNLIGTVVAGYAVKQVASTMVAKPLSLADQYSSAKIGFSTLLGDKKGQAMMDEIDKFAKETPFKTSGVISNVQKMMAYGWDADRVIKDMETIGDAAASTGRGDEGLESIVYALSEIRSKGKLSTQELNQLASAGIKAKQYLAEGLGYGSDDKGMAKMMKDLEKGAIGAQQGIDLILKGMEEFDGMMDRTANETVEGLWSQIQDAFEINVFRRWGQGLQDGAKRGFGAIVKLLDDSESALSSLGDTLYNVGKAISNWAADKLEKAVKTIKEVTDTDAFKNANLGGKIKILWGEVIAKPFSKWWNSTGKKTVAKIAGSIGKGIGMGITGGILALLGIDATGVLQDGASIGGSFMEGFLEGFDTSKIGDALSEWVSKNKVLAIALGAVLGVKLLSGIGNALGNIKNLLPGGSKGGTGGTMLSDAYAGTMNVTAGVVNVYGGKGFNTSGLGGNGAGNAGGGNILLPGGGSTAKKLLTSGGKTAGQKLLTSGAGKAATSGAGKTLTGVVLKDGTIAATGSKLVAGAAKVGVSLGSGATTAGGAALAGTAGSAGIAGIAAGTISAGVDVVQGVKKGKAGDKKGAKDEYFSAGTKVGMMGTGAAIGAAIGSVIPGAGTLIGGLVGGGIGGIVGMFTGDKAGKALSDSTDEGGALSNAWDSTKNFFTNTIPEAWDSFWGGITGFFTSTVPTWWSGLTEKVSSFFTETIPNAWNSFWDPIGNFFTETIPSAWGKLTEKVSEFFTVTIPEKWNEFWSGVGNFFTETVPYALGYATGKVVTFFTETIPNAWNSFWDVVGNFFTETIPAWAEFVKDAVVAFFTIKVPEAWNSFWGAISTFFTETIPAWAEGIWNDHIYPFFTDTIPTFFSNLWDSIATFFTETIPAWAEGVWNDHIVPFFTESIPTFFSNLWDSISTFFTETLPEWAEGVWNNNIVPFFTESIPTFFSNLWDSISTFFTETLPGWAEGIWNNNIVPFFTESIPNFFGSIWDSICGFFDESIDFIAEQIWAPIRGFFTETLPGWANSAIDKVKSWWSSVKENFMAGYEDGSGGGDSEGGRARGGIAGGTSSSMEAFARGGRTDGGIVGGSTRWIRVNEESPEMIIPLSSQRRERAMKLWAKTGQLLGVPGFSRGGRTTGENDEGLRFHGNEPEPTDTRSVVVDVGGINIEIKVDGTDKDSVVRAIKEQIADIAESVAGIFADEFEAVFENTPVRGGVT